MTPQPKASRRWIPVALMVAVIVAGALQRWWVATHAIGTLSADGGVTGLMALRFLHHGQLTAYTWGQSYSGTLEPALTGLVFAVAGVGTSQLIATTAGTSAVCGLALWWAGRRIVGEAAARIGALVFWVWPAAVLWRSLKPGGAYMIGLALALLAVGALAGTRNGDRTWRNAALAGLAAGLALWCNPLALELLLPAALWCLPALLRLRLRLLAMAAGGIAGWSPALYFGLTHAWTNLHMPGYKSDLVSGFPGRFGQFFSTEGPIAMGVREEGSLAWLGGPFGQVLAWASVAALLAVACLVIIGVRTGRARRYRLPVLAIALLPVLYALIPLADHAGQGRYALFAVPMAALLIGSATDSAIDSAASRNNSRTNNSRTNNSAALITAIGLTAACALGAAGLIAEPGRQIVAFPAPDVAMPVDDTALLGLLRAHDVRYAYANYWIAYRVTFETGGQVTVTPDDFDRYPPLARSVAASPHPAYLFISASRTLPAFVAWCHGHAIGCQSWSDGGFTLVQPAVNVSPASLPATVVS